MSYIFTSQDCESLHHCLKKRSVHLHVDLILKLKWKSDINPEIFNDYITRIFIFYLNKLWSNQEFADQTPILVINNYLNYIIEEIVDFPSQTHEQVFIISFVSHTM
jgi:hypothetical protein